MDTNKLIASTKVGKKALNEFSERITSEYAIDGKTPVAWKEYFHITIPKNANMEEIRATASKLTELIGTATYYKAQSQLVSDALEAGSKEEYIETYESLVTTYQGEEKKIPAQKTLETLTQGKMKEVSSALNNANMKLRFWKTILEGLVEQRKTLEQMMWSLHAEMKILHND
jgi:hypothetical protein